MDDIATISKQVRPMYFMSRVYPSVVFRGCLPNPHVCTERVIGDVNSAASSDMRAFRNSI